jgi:EAL domain-containing protein (putative c-di-GMP-specific phosphodiesterase class I)
MQRTFHSNEAATWFQPIVDTFEHRVLGHACRPQCGVPPPGAPQAGLYFIDLMPGSLEALELSIDATVDGILESGLAPGNVVFELAEPDLAREPVRLRRIYNELRSHGFGSALTGVGVSAGANSLQVVQELLPDYIKLDERLIQNIHQAMCASMIGKLVGLADQWGLRVIADGVARQSAVEDLWLLGVQFMQGALFGEAAPWPLASRSDDPRRYTRICHSRSTHHSLTSKA